MMYVEFVRPNGRKLQHAIALDDRSEKLYEACINHPSGNQFTYEDCGGFINLCFEAWVDQNDSDDTVLEDVVCEIVSHECMRDHRRRLDAWAMTVAKAADYFEIHIPTEA